MLKKITKAELKATIEEAHRRAKANNNGKNADYIPYLSNINPELFGITVCLPNGELLEVGDTNAIFGIESVSKVHTAILAMKQHGADAIHKRIGADATGMPFNSIIAILLENNHHSTPLVNAGAIAACSIIEPKGDSDGKWQAIVNNMRELCGSDLTLIDELYKSETDTNYNNRSIAWLLKNYNRLFDEPDMSLDLYTRQCSMGVTCSQLAITAATIAFEGVNPVTKQTVFAGDIASRITSLMATVGFYESSGDWMFNSGLPAKTGVGGGIMGVLPGVMGIAAYSPPLDKSGNSVRAQEAIAFIMDELGANIFNASHIEITD